MYTWYNHEQIVQLRKRNALTGRITNIVTNVEWHNYFNNPTPIREMTKSVETQRINMMNKRRHLTPNAHTHMSPTHAQIYKK